MITIEQKLALDFLLRMLVTENTLPLNTLYYIQYKHRVNKNGVSVYHCAVYLQWNNRLVNITNELSKIFNYKQDKKTLHIVTQDSIYDMRVNLEYILKEYTGIEYHIYGQWL